MSDQVHFSLDFKILNLLIQLKVIPGYRNTYVGPLNEIFVFNAQPRHMTLAPVVQTMDSAVHRINHYPADKH